eukprot:SAG11_NODE_36625_length_260_cov_1.608696_1_plen_52_part_01
MCEMAFLGPVVKRYLGRVQIFGVQLLTASGTAILFVTQGNPYTRNDSGLAAC